MGAKKAGKMTKRMLALLLAAAVGTGGMDTGIYAQTVPAETETSMTAGDDASENEKTEPGNDGVTAEDIYEGKNFNVTFTLTERWKGGYNATVKIENTGDDIIENWSLGMDYSSEVSNIWNAAVSAHTENYYVIKNAGWNQNIEAGKSVEFGISGQEDFKGFPEGYQLIGQLNDVKEDAYDIDYAVSSDWGDGFTADISIKNNTDSTLEDWILEFDFDREITEIWNGTIESHENNHYVIKNAGYNANIPKNNSVSVGFKGKDGSKSDVPKNYELKSYELKSRQEYMGDSFEMDTDEDGLPDGVETKLGLDYRKADTDGDGLTDYQELYMTMTDPLLTDTDDNGTSDADEDLDGDGLTNKREIDAGTDPACEDTDGDNLTDFDEISRYKSDPLAADTDGDGLDDYDDVFLGFSPLLQDTDGNGILDPDEKLNQTVENSFSDNEGRGIIKVDVSMNTSGNINKNVGIINVYEMDSLSRDVVGLVGVPVEIRSKVSFDIATIKFTYDEKALGGTKEEDLAVLWYDEANGWYQILDRESVVDTKNHTVSYETTHFSTYMLVDKNTWYEAWRENIDYRTSSEGDETANSFDIAFVVDVSGSMRGMCLENAKTSLCNFVDAMQEDGDAAALISFSSYASILAGFTNNKAALKRKINSLYVSGGTNVNDGLLKALNAFAYRRTDKKRIIVLICDGDVNYYQPTIDVCIDYGIQIYAVNVQSVPEHEKLQKMADQTNGQYYYVNSADEISKMFGMIQNETVDRIDPTDNDGDGLYDIYETAGIKLPNGQVIYTDPALKDTDGDGLTDFEETGIIYNVDDRYIGMDVVQSVKYFMMHSNPAVKDSDGDGIGDKEDEDPWNKDAVTDELSNRYSGIKYLKFTGLGDVHGGNQDWWSERTNLDPDSKWERYEDYVLSQDYRMGIMGCGVIAMTDLELYLTQQHDGYSAPLNSSINYNEETGEIDRSKYMSYAEFNMNHVYHLGDDLLHYNTGVLPTHMVSGMRYYLSSNKHPYTKVVWAPLHCGKADAKIGVASKIEKMISRDLPVVFSYYSPDDGIGLYRNLEDAKALAKVNEDAGDRNPDSHYMTVIGYVKYLKDDGINYSYILEVVSWGKIYYINYDEYAKKLNWFSNILEIGDGGLW